MEYRRQDDVAKAKIKPRLILHGGAGNITPAMLPPAKYQIVRISLLTMLARTNAYMIHPNADGKLPSALEVAVHAVTQLELNPIFNAGHGAVFTRDGINELEASVMVSRGFKKRGVGVTGLRHVRSPIALAKAMLEHGEEDLERDRKFRPLQTAPAGRNEAVPGGIDVPSAQGHTLVHGEAAETLAKSYGLELVEQSYFFTQMRWDEHIRALEDEKKGKGEATYSKVDYLPQGTTGCVALDEDGVLCCATSTGGMTNKLTGRIGDTPVVGAGFWAEEWSEDGDPTGSSRMTGLSSSGPMIELSGALKGLLADCLPTPLLYSPLSFDNGVKTTRSFAVSGTGNGDSFMRVNAARSASAIARWQPATVKSAVAQIAGIGGELEKSAGDRWLETGEGQGGMISIENVVVRDKDDNVMETRSDIVHEHNCAGMFRAWIDSNDKARMQIWHDGTVDANLYRGEALAEDVSNYFGEKI